MDFDPDKSAQVYPIFGGTITNVSCGIGDPVKKGQVLVVIKSANVAELEKQKKMKQTRKRLMPNETWMR